LNFDKSKVNKILVIKPAAIGDVLLSTPVIENLRYNFPNAEINFLTQTYCRDVVSDNPFLSRVLTYEKSDRRYCIIKNIRRQKYDLAIDLFCNPGTAVITFLSRARYRVGYGFRFRSYAYNIKVSSRSGEVHNIDFNLDALRFLGLEIITRQPLFEVNNIHREFADKWIEETGLAGKEIIGINASGTWETKVWPPEKFIELISLLRLRYEILLFWGNEKERTAAEEIKSRSAGSIHLIPEVNLKYAAALMKKCKVFISNDTGPMHVAWVVGVPVCGIYGPTKSKLQGPLGNNSVIVENDSLECLGCNLTKVKDCPYNHACMRELPVTEVYRKLKGLMERVSKVTA